MDKYATKEQVRAVVYNAAASIHAKKIDWAFICDPRTDRQRRIAFIEIDVDYARELLEHSRPGNEARLNMQKALTYARCLEEDTWKNIDDPIVIDTNGYVINGRHRLVAIVESGIPLVCLVVLDGDPDSFPGYDSGLARTRGHNLVIQSAEKYKYPIGKRVADLMCAAVPRINSLENGGRKPVHDPDKPNFHRLFEERDGLLLCTDALSGYMKDLITPSYALAIYYCFHRRNYDFCNWFFRDFNDKFAAANSHPGMARFAVETYMRRIKMTTAVQKDAACRHCCALIIKAWNNACKNRPIPKNLVYREGSESWPSILTPSSSAVDSVWPDKS